MKGPCPTCGRDTYSEWIPPSRDPLPPHKELTSADFHPPKKPAPKPRKSNVRR